MEAFFDNHATQYSFIGTVGTVFENGLLACQRGCVNQIRDSDLVSPAMYSVVKDIMEMGAAFEQVSDHLFSCLDPKVGRDHVEKMSVTDLVLAFRQRGHFSMQTRGLWYPISFSKPSHVLTVGVHLNEPEYGFTVWAWDVIVGFNDAAVVKEVFEFTNILPVAHNSIIQTNVRWC